MDYRDLERALLERGIRRKPTLDEIEEFLYEKELDKEDSFEDEDIQELNFDG